MDFALPAPVACWYHPSGIQLSAFTVADPRVWNDLLEQTLAAQSLAIF